MNWREWIKHQGISKVAKQMDVTYECVRAWVNDKGMPKDDHKKELVSLSNGEFGFGTFFE